MPGLLAWRYSFDVAATQGQTPYFAVFEAEFADAAAMTASRSSPQGRQVAADVANYATGGAVVIHYPVRDGTGWAINSPTRTHRSNATRIYVNPGGLWI